MHRSAPDCGGLCIITSLIGCSIGAQLFIGCWIRCLYFTRSLTNMHACVCIPFPPPFPQNCRDCHAALLWLSPGRRKMTDLLGLWEHLWNSWAWASFVPDELLGTWSFSLSQAVLSQWHPWTSHEAATERLGRSATSAPRYHELLGSSKANSGSAESDCTPVGLPGAFFYASQPVSPQYLVICSSCSPRSPSQPVILLSLICPVSVMLFFILSPLSHLQCVTRLT